MKILAIESSCDETSASVVNTVDGGIAVDSNITATSLALHATTGGIIPENAAREQAKYILPTIIKSLTYSETNEKSEIIWSKAKTILENDINAIAVTVGPGLIGSLLVGVETAKTLAYAFGKPIIPVNHLLAHVYANYINRKINDIKFPYIGLIVSGGHTDLLIFYDHKNYKWLGGTRDDAAGEALDKTGRLLDLSYPAGPEIEKRASLVQATDIRFKSPLFNEKTFDFSFSGLKAEVARFVKKQKAIDTNTKSEICYAIQKAIVDVLVKKTISAANENNAKMVLVGGGVSANQTFKKRLGDEALQYGISILFPELKYATDNAAMVGAYALLNGTTSSWQEVKANPELYFL